MNALDVMFTTDRFNLSVVKPEFINDCCFGDDLGRWLRKELEERRVIVEGPGQEDWGWYLETSSDAGDYFLNMSGNSDEDASAPNRGEWRIIVERRQSIKEKLTGKGQVDQDDPMLQQVFSICKSQPDFLNVRLESG